MGGEKARFACTKWIDECVGDDQEGHQQANKEPRHDGSCSWYFNCTVISHEKSAYPAPDYLNQAIYNMAIKISDFHCCFIVLIRRTVSRLLAGADSGRINFNTIWGFDKPFPQLFYTPWLCNYSGRRRFVIFIYFVPYVVVDSGLNFNFNKFFNHSRSMMDSHKFAKQ